MKNKNRTVACILLITLIGGVAGYLISDVKETATVPLSVPTTLSGFDSIRMFLLKTCFSTFVQTFLVFISRFTLYPWMIVYPLFAFRGFAAGYVMNCARLSEASELSSIISYLLITAIFVPLYLSSFSHQHTVSRMRSALNAAYAFLLVLGAAIIIRTVPILITSA